MIHNDVCQLEFRGRIQGRICACWRVVRHKQMRVVRTIEGQDAERVHRGAAWRGHDGNVWSMYVDGHDMHCAAKELGAAPRHACASLQQELQGMHA